MNFVFKPTENLATPMRNDLTFDDCKATCDQTTKCQSFASCKDGSCYLNRKYLQGNEESFESGVSKECFTSFSIGKSVLSFFLQIQNYFNIS